MRRHVIVSDFTCVAESLDSSVAVGRGIASACDDATGNRTSVADADGNASNWSYDPLGQLRVDYYLPLSELSWMTCYGPNYGRILGRIVGVEI